MAEYVLIALGAIWGAIKAAAATWWIWASLALTIASYAYSYFTQDDSKPHMPDMPDTEDPGFKVNTRSTQEAIKIIYGQQVIGPNSVYVYTSGNSNKYLYMVDVLGEGELDSVITMWLGDKNINDVGRGGLWRYNFYEGTSTQTKDTLIEGGNAQHNDPYRYTSYVAVRLLHHIKWFQGAPIRKYEVKGRKLYDPRDASTLYSCVPALALYDYMRHDRYGLGKVAAFFDIDSVKEAATYCENQGWEIHMVIKGTPSAQDIIDKICTLFRGKVIWWNGKFYFRYSDLTQETSQMTIEDKHIARDEKNRVMLSLTQPSRFKKPDGIRVKYIDGDNLYTPNDILIGDAEGNIISLDLTHVTDRELASVIGTYTLERARLDRIISGTFRVDCSQLDPNDIITLNSSSFNISDQLMRVQDSKMTTDQVVEMTLAYEDLALYNDTYDLVEDSVYTTDLPDPSLAPDSVENVSIRQEFYIERLRRRCRLKIVFDSPSNFAWYDHVEIHANIEDLWLTGGSYVIDNYVRNQTDVRYKCIVAHTSSSSNEPGAGVDWETYWVEVDWEHLLDTTSSFTIDPVEEGRWYFFIIKVVSLWGTSEELTDAYKISYQVEGFIERPESLTFLEASVNENSINLYSDRVDDSDVELYEFRLGSTWIAAMFLGQLRAPNFSLVGVKPGLHTFWVNTLGNNGLYGANPMSATVTLPDPPDGWGLITTKTEDYQDRQNFDLFTEVDENSTILVTGEIIIFEAITSDETSYVVKDFGVEYFSGEFLHSFQFKVTDMAVDPFLNVWAVANVSGEYDNIKDNEVDGELCLTLDDTIGAGDFKATIVEVESGSKWSGEVANLYFDTDYYCTIWRNDGSGEYGVLSAYIYDDDYKSSLLGSGEVNLHNSMKQFRYGYGLQTTVGIGGGAMSGEVRNFSVGEYHDNTEHVIYSVADYLKSPHLGEELSGEYWSEIYDLGSSGRYLTYVLADIVYIGSANTWEGKFPSITTWAQGGVGTLTWAQIFELVTAPGIDIRVKYGDTNPPTNEVKKMEILSSVIEGRYFQVGIIITDPSVVTNALVENYELKFCQVV